MATAAFSHGGFSLFDEAFSHAPGRAAKLIPDNPTRLKYPIPPERYTAGHPNLFHRHDN